MKGGKRGGGDAAERAARDNWLGGVDGMSVAAVVDGEVLWLG